MTLDITEELKKLEGSINNLISLNIVDPSKFMAKIYFYKLNGYEELIFKLDKENYLCKTTDEKNLYLEKYKMIFLSERKMCLRTLKALDKESISLVYPKSNEKFLKEYLKKINLYSNEKSLYENTKDYLKVMIKMELETTNELLYSLKKYPFEYINTPENFIGPEPVYRYRKDIVLYKDAYITISESPHYSVFSNDKTKESTKVTLLNIMAYLSGRPYFYFTENYVFNNKLSNLYEQFDLLDMLRLRRENFFESTEDNPLHLELPILKQTKGYSIVHFEDSQHEMLFELYHASLKQFESLPRCVFLFRVFEYGAQHHYKPLMKPSDYKVEDAIQYYANEVIKHNYLPLYYVDYGTYMDEKEKKFIRKRKAKLVNFMTELKKEARKIEKEWSQHPFLKKKSLGEIIYTHGRNAAAHGGSGRGNAKYDYSKNYKLLNDVNIFLELIARYIMELLNPQLKNIVERRTRYYITENHSHAFSDN
ncbi:hypothetical protein [Priestia endophytica]|uniref:hypothetical protein n=1 Tax=Priestia endophytica TaxID=135735 RepID=UPI00124F20B2|nr:hypothetical protein [Priestia endophytica]KAB2489631.1 hypothetical protein F8155_23135 [Priestia endophytica]